MPSDVQLEALVRRSACAPHVVKHCSAFYTARPIYTSEGLFQKTVRHLHHQGEELIWNHTADDRLYLFPIASWISSFVLEWCLPFRTTPFVWAPSSFDEHIISFFHRHILSYLSSESHKKHPPGLAGKKKKFAQLSCPYFWYFLLLHDTLCTHQSQTASDGADSATVARYVKFGDIEFHPVPKWFASIMVLAC